MNFLRFVSQNLFKRKGELAVIKVDKYGCITLTLMNEDSPIIKVHSLFFIVSLLIKNWRFELVKRIPQIPTIRTQFSKGFSTSSISPNSIFICQFLPNMVWTLSPPFKITLQTLTCTTYRLKWTLINLNYSKRPLARSKCRVSTRNFNELSFTIFKFFHWVSHKHFEDNEFL